MFALSSSFLRLLELGDTSVHGMEARDKREINVPWSAAVQKSHTDIREQWSCAQL